MRMPSFNKQEDTAICLFCKKNKVSLSRWNRPCDECKSKRIAKVGTETAVRIGKRLVAAVVQQGDKKMFVDKFGVPVEDHHYDLENDPRGYKATGTTKEKPKRI